MAAFRFTLFVYLSLALAVAASSSPNSFGLHRRDHADLGRLLKKRTPIDVLGNQPSAQGQQTPQASPVVQPTQDTSASAQTTPASVQTTAATGVSSSANPSTTNGGGLLGSVLTGLLPTGSSTASSTLPTTTPSSAPNSQSSAPQTSAHVDNTSTTTPTQSILYLTSSSVPTPTQTSSTSSSSGMSHAAMTVLVVIAASVGAAVIVWTIIRKWKFRPSSDFEGRMQPIDWQPGGNEDGLPGRHRPLSRASSFHSGSGNGHVDDQARGPMNGYGSSSLNPIPDHDFTAGPAHLAPVGGYADLARGPSPQPMMQETLGRAPSINRHMQQYDQHGVPLYHGYSAAY